jgi:hypothetical protein
MTEFADEARKLLSEALFLAESGERPPGAPNDPQAETWADWFRRIEAFLRAEPERKDAAIQADEEFAPTLGYLRSLDAEDDAVVRTHVGHDGMIFIEHPPR